MASALVMAADINITDNWLAEPPLFASKCLSSIPTAIIDANISRKNRVIPVGPTLSGVVPSNNNISPVIDTNNQTDIRISDLFRCFFVLVSVNDSAIISLKLK
ncbi:MAG TPA: hypothetical protein VF996_00305 [Candidatus Saccharimonadales bacterium]